MMEPNVLQDDRLILRITTTLGDWLRREDWQPQQLIDWLEGDKLPRVGYEDEPYVWILQGLPLGDERCWAETRLAERVATVLEGEPDKKKPGRRPEQVLFNLFMVCAGLNCPDELNKPLIEVLKRKALKGEWLKIDLRYALQVALIWNQLDRQLESDWMTMLSGRRHRFLPGDHYDGFEGVLWMPESATLRGQPHLYAIGAALSLLAQRMKSHRDRNDEFRSIVQRVISAHPRPTWAVDLRLQADRHELPQWAQDCLPGGRDEQELGQILKNFPKALKQEAYALIERRPSPAARMAAAVGRHMARVVERFKARGSDNGIDRSAFAHAHGINVAEPTNAREEVAS